MWIFVVFLHLFLSLSFSNSLALCIVVIVVFFIHCENFWAYSRCFNLNKLLCALLPIFGDAMCHDDATPECNPTTKQIQTTKKYKEIIKNNNNKIMKQAIEWNIITSTWNHKQIRLSLVPTKQLLHPNANKSLHQKSKTAHRRTHTQTHTLAQYWAKASTTVPWHRTESKPHLTEIYTQRTQWARQMPNTLCENDMTTMR